MYRYLASKVGPEEAAKKLSVLEGFIEKLHRWVLIKFLLRYVEIMY